MPIKAMEVKTGKTILSTLIPNPRSAYVRGEIVCPDCRGEMTVVTPTKKIVHFRHVGVIDCPDDPYAKDSEPETIQHIAGKTKLMAILQEKYPESQGYQVIPEYGFPEIGRRADMVLIDPKGYIRAYEVQFSAISHTKLEERTRSYELAGIEIVWLFGGDACTDSNIAWAHERFTPVYRLMVKISEDHEKYSL